MNITEFAKIAGVSKSAVSRYFNNGYLAGEKRLLIEVAIEKTGYAPSLQAQTVRTRITKLVGVILPKLSSESCARVVEGIGEVLDKEGYQILLVNTNNQEEKEVEYLDLFKQNRVDGVILLATILTSNHKKVLKQMQIPVIMVGQEYSGYSCVCHDDYGAAYALTSHMLEKNRRKPAIIRVTEEDKAAGYYRNKGYEDALQAYEIIDKNEYKAVSKFDMESGYQAMKNIGLRNQKNMPDCLFCATDTIAMGAMKWLREEKYRIPEDIMITSIGDSKIASVAAIPITSVHLHYKTSGMAAAEMFLEQLRKKEWVCKTTKLGYIINERDSTRG